MGTLSSYAHVTTLAGTERVPVVVTPGVAGGNAYITVAEMVASAPFNRCLGVHSLATAFVTAAVHTTYQDEGLTLTKDETSGRRLKFTLVVNPFISGGANSVNYQILRDGVSMRAWTIPTEALSATVTHGMTLMHTEVVAATHAGSVFKVQLKAGGANTAVNSYGDASLLRQLIIEDIGT